MKNTWKRFITIVMMVGLMLTAIGCYDQMKVISLERGAYEYLSSEIYGDFSDLKVKEIIPQGDGRYELRYTYTRGGDGHHISGTHYDVSL